MGVINTLLGKTTHNMIQYNYLYFSCCSIMMSYCLYYCLRQNIHCLSYLMVGFVRIYIKLIKGAHLFVFICGHLIRYIIARPIISQDAVRGFIYIRVL